MAKINHNISVPNDGLGDQLRTAFDNQNAMNTELYANKVEKAAGKDLSDNNFTDENLTKLNSLEAGAGVQIQSDWEQSDNTAKDFIKNKPLEMFSSVGSFHYVDLATQTTPLNVVTAVEKKITNDTLDPLTNVLNAPYGINSMWDTVNNQLDFTQTSIGDLITLIPEMEITTTVANQDYYIWVRVGIGSSLPQNKQIYHGSLKAPGSIIVNPTKDFSIDSLDIKDYPAEIFILTDANATVKSGTLDIKVVRKDVNVVTDHAHTNLTLLETFTSTLKANWEEAYTWIFTNGATLINHLSNTSNPHSVTYTQVGAQAPLVSATNIKTINGATILGAGDLVIDAGVALGETDTTAYRGDRGKTAYDHSQSAHAPTDAQKNSDITKAEIEAKLTGEITTHTHAGITAVNADTLTTAISITSATQTDGLTTQDGKIIRIANGVNVINYTVNGITASFVKGGTGAITFVQGAGRTLTGVNGTLVFNGAVGSTASIASFGTVDYLYINNL